MHQGATGLPDFSCNNVPKWKKYIPNDYKTYPKTMKFNNSFHSKTLQKYTQIRIFGTKNVTSGNPGVQPSEDFSIDRSSMFIFQKESFNIVLA
jgi:hypothetical protein